MANIGTSAVRIIDSDGDVVTVTSNKLDVNATLADGTEILEAGYSTVNHIAVNVTDSAVQFGSNTCSHIDIMANLSNTGIVYIGASGVGATTGIALYPGDVYSCNVGNTNLLYSISTVSGDDLNIVIYR